MKKIIKQLSKRKINIYKFKSDMCEIKHPKKVSVIIPNYNYEDYIIERIDSVLKQTYPIHELIILDDCSTDHSVNIIKNKIKTISNLKVVFIENKENSGCVFSQWKKGLDLVTGDYFWIAEADDSCKPQFLETLMKGFLNPNVVLSYCESARMDENNYLIDSESRGFTDIFKTGDWDNDFVHKGFDEIKNKLSVTNTILNVSSLVWKKRAYQTIFEEAKQFKVAGDWYIYFKVLLNGDLAYFRESLNYFRKHSKSATKVVKADLEFKEVLKMQSLISARFY